MKRFAAIFLTCCAALGLEESTWVYYWPPSQSGGPYHLIIKNERIESIVIPSVTPWLEINYVFELFPPDTYYIDVYSTNLALRTSALIYSNFPVRWKMPDGATIPSAPTDVRIIE